MCRGRGGSVVKRSSRTQNRDVSCSGGVGGHRWSEVFLSRGGNIDVIGIHSDIVVEQGEKEGIKNFLGDMR